MQGDNQQPNINLIPKIKFTDLDDMSIKDLINLAEENYELMNYDKCYFFYEEALRKDPKDENLLCSFGYFLANVKDIEKAKKILSQAILINPDKNHKKFLHLAELLDGEQAAQLYLNAIKILTTILNAKYPSGIPVNPTNIQSTYPKEEQEQKEDMDYLDAIKDLSQAYSALGELYMTDLARIPNAINICREYLMISIEIDPNNLDGYLQLANYFLEIDNPETAEEYMQKFIEKYKILSENESFVNEYSDDMLLQAVRTFIEIQGYANALIVLEDLIDDNAKDPEVLYLLTYCNFMIKNYLTSQEYLDELNKLPVIEDHEIRIAKEELEQELKKVDYSKGNDYEENKEECMSNESMDLQ